MDEREEKDREEIGDLRMKEKKDRERRRNNIIIREVNKLEEWDWIGTQQMKMDLNRQKWIRFVRVKSRFWYFESIFIQLKFPNFWKPILIHMKG